MWQPVVHLFAPGLLAARIHRHLRPNSCSQACIRLLIEDGPLTMAPCGLVPGLSTEPSHSPDVSNLA